ncbi:MAG: PTS glucose transporter subunit IIA [Lachnospiraceae bacterium]|nr:PTS glucose transporter subunit IIA [Lachnospiraceae bacterium]
MVKQGDKVKAGQPCVEVDWATIKAAGLDTSTMLIITEPVDGKEYQSIDNQAVECMQKVNK